MKWDGRIDLLHDHETLGAELRIHFGDDDLVLEGRFLQICAYLHRILALTTVVKFRCKLLGDLVEGGRELRRKCVNEDFESKDIAAEGALGFRVLHLDDDTLAGGFERCAMDLPMEAQPTGFSSNAENTSSRGPELRFHDGVNPLMSRGGISLRNGWNMSTYIFGTTPPCWRRSSAHSVVKPAELHEFVKQLLFPRWCKT